MKHLNKKLSFLEDELGISWNVDFISNALWAEGSIDEEYNFLDCDFLITDNIRFNDDIWDFTKEKPAEHKATYYYYDFSDINDKYKGYLKLLLLRERKKKENLFPTVHDVYTSNRKFINFLEDRSILSFELITPEVLIEFFDTLHSVAQRAKARYRWNIGNFLKEIVIKNTFVYLEDCFEWLDEEDNKSESKIKAEEQAGKSNLIPFNFYNKLISFAVQEIKNENATEKDIISACAIIILGETGIRIGELKLLEVNKLDEIKLDELKETEWTLEFWTYKVRKRWTWTVLTEVAKYAIDTLTKRLKERRGKSKYLLVSTKGDKYEEDSIRRYIVRFFIKYQHDLFCNIKREELEQFEFKVMTKSMTDIYGKKFRGYMGKTVYYAHPHQFRVTCATKLAMKYPLIWIKEYMNHMMEEMTQHYIRDTVFKEKIYQSAALIEETLRQRANENGDMLELRSEKIDDEEIEIEISNEECIKSYELINEFLKKNKFNIFKNINEIIKKLQSTNIPIMEMDIGFCVSAALGALCERQKYLKYIREQNEFINVQMPNLATIHLTYSRFVEKVKIVRHNSNISKKNSKYKKAYLDEKHSLSDFIKEKFLPEIIKLKEKLDNHQKELILNKYPKTEYIISNLPKIEKEVSEWI